MNQKNQKGFALLLTLSVLSVIIGLTVVLLSYFTKVRHNAELSQALIQGNIYYADVLSEFKRFVKKPETIFSALYRFPVSIRSDDGRFFVTIKCEALGKGVNINWLGLEHNLTKQPLYLISEELFEYLATEYNIEEPDRLREMILEEIGIGQKFIQKRKQRLMQKEGIITYRQFLDVINRYQLEVDDSTVSKIGWDRYFSFADVDRIDAEYSSSELLAFLFDIDVSSVKEWNSLLIGKPSLMSFVNENGGDYASKKNILAGGNFLGASHCSVDYGSGYRFTFKYINGESKHFEFYGK